MAREYVFVDEWDVDAPIDAVFDALADARTYPEWWKPVYFGVGGEGEPGVGQVTRHFFKGKLPYTLTDGRPNDELRPADESRACRFRAPRPQRAAFAHRLPSPARANPARSRLSGYRSGVAGNPCAYPPRSRGRRVSSTLPCASRGSPVLGIRTA